MSKHKKAVEVCLISNYQSLQKRREPSLQLAVAPRD